jgi:ubiquinone/menaquinone biosynthesis C-methylase UbiE
MNTRDRLETEFGIYSEWLAQAVAKLGPTQTIPVACRGTGKPDLFRRIGEDLHITAESLVLDVGSGLGGPAAWLMAEKGCRVVGIDLMEAEVRASSQLFPDLATVVARAEELPWRPGSFSAAWALGVIEMVQEKERVVSEIARVLKKGGRAAFYGFFATDRTIEHLPSANRFQPLRDLLDLLNVNRLRVVKTYRSEPTPPPPEWRLAVEKVRAQVRSQHAGDSRLILAETQVGAFNWLRNQGQISDWIVIGEKVDR